MTVIDSLKSSIENTAKGIEHTTKAIEHTGKAIENTGLAAANATEAVAHGTETINKITETASAAVGIAKEATQALESISGRVRQGSESKMEKEKVKQDGQLEITKKNIQENIEKANANLKNKEEELRTQINKKKLQADKQISTEELKSIRHNAEIDKKRRQIKNSSENQEILDVNNNELIKQQILNEQQIKLKTLDLKQKMKMAELAIKASNNSNISRIITDILENRDKCYYLGFEKKIVEKEEKPVYLNGNIPYENSWTNWFGFKKSPGKYYLAEEINGKKVSIKTVINDNKTEYFYKDDNDDIIPKDELQTATGTGVILHNNGFEYVQLDKVKTLDKLGATYVKSYINGGKTKRKKKRQTKKKTKRRTRRKR